MPSAPYLERWRQALSPAMLPLLVALVHVALIAASLFPSLGQIGSWDESVCIDLGRQIVAGEWPQYAAGPLVGVVYALAYLPVQWSDDWLVYCNWIGRVVFIALLWFACFQVARQLRARAHPLLLLVLVAVSPILVAFLANGSMALFTALSGLALAQTLGFERTGRIACLWRASLLVGLSALARSEGPVLFVILLVVSIPVCVRERVVWKGLVACLVPFLALNAGYVGLRGLATGDFSPGTKGRAYFTFEQGHGMAFADSHGDRQFYVEGQVTAPLVFGTAEENDHSILKAIRRNPEAYLSRIPRLTRMAISDAFAGYGAFFGLFCGAFALRGLIELVRTRAFHLAAILVAWAGYAVLYVLLCYQPSHLLMPFLTLLSLAAVGLAAFTNNLGSLRERSWWTGALVAVALAAVVLLKPLSTLGRAPLVFLLALWIVWIVFEWNRRAPYVQGMACLVLLAAAMALKTGPDFRPPMPGGDPDKPAVAYLAGRFEPGTRIAAWALKSVWAARLEPVTMGPDQRNLKTPADVAAWLDKEGISGVYVDAEFRRYEPEIVALVQALVGSSLEIGFDGGAERVQVLVRSSEI